ncbi:MAG: PqqD family protein, partial [Vicinamibacterales bacterium]|nr:PqqD family protein [Vicinamibacterales bacterium]
MMSELDFASVQPRRLLEWCEEDGRCVLLRPRLGSSRLARWVAGLGGDPHYRIRLDEVGTLIWKACDGQTALADIVALMRKRFGDQVEPADERLARFVRKMVKGRLITLEPAGVPPA